jgi:hypothetical protein
MARAALIEHRPWLVLALAAAILYYFLTDAAIGEVWLMLLQAISFAALAAYALIRGSGAQSVLLAVLLLLAGAGITVAGLDLFWGGALVGLAYLCGAGLFAGRLRHSIALSSRVMGAALAASVPALFLLFGARGLALLYAAALGSMALLAWFSRFPRARVGTGTLGFVVADLIKANEADPAFPDGVALFLTWPLFFGGMFLIATGIVQTLRHELKEEDG